MNKPKAWLITGSTMFRDAVVQREETADQRIKERGERDNSRKVPLYTAEDLTPPPRTYEQGAEEMRGRAAAKVWTAMKHGGLTDAGQICELIRALPTQPEGEGE